MIYIIHSIIQTPTFAKNYLVLYKKAFTVVLLFIFLAQTFSRYVVMADYCMNTQEYIRYCIYKDKPIMHCNGKCQLEKKLQQQDNPDKQTTERKTGNDGGPLSSKSWFAQVSSTAYFNSNKNYPETQPGKTIQMPRALFHPPGISVS